MKWGRFINYSLENVHHAALWLALFSLASAVLGLFRDRLFASAFGASRTLDMYYAAFRMPDLIYTILLFFAASTAIIPVFLVDISKDRQRAQELFGSLLFMFSAAFLFLCIVVYIFTPFLTRMFLPGFSLEEQMTVVQLSRILLLSPLFLGLSNIFSGITQSLRKFFVYGLSPLLYNVGIIVGIVFFLPRFGLAGLADGVAFGAFLHMVIQIPTLFHAGVFPRFSVLLHDDIRRVLALSIPRTLGLTTTQITNTILTGIASTFTAGSIAVYTLSSNLEMIPVTLIGLSYSVAAFPNLAELAINGAKEEFRQHFGLALRHIIFWSAPFAALLLVLRAQIVRVILGAGEFGWTDTRLTAASLFILSISVIFQGLFMLLVRAFYAGNETARPVFINVLSAILSIGAVFWFSKVLYSDTITSVAIRWVLHLRDIEDIRILALPLGILAGSIANFLFLLAAFRSVFSWDPLSRSYQSIWQILIASIAGSIAA